MYQQPANQTNDAQPPTGSVSYQTMAPGGGHTSVYLGNPQFNGFDHKSVRSAFVSKVFSIVAVQLLFSAALIAWFTLHQPTKNYFLESGQPWLYSALGVGLVVFLILSCVDSARRSFPLNFGLLTLLTLAYGLIAAILAGRYNTNTVLCAFAATAFATIVVILLAKYSPFDLTTCGCGLCVLGLLHLFATMILLLVLVPDYAETASLIIAGLGAFLVSLYMLFDLQLIMGGRSVELSPEEYILAAALLYIDIIQIFQYMLILFGGRD